MSAKQVSAQKARFEKTRKTRQDKFINKAIKVHDGLYDYSKVFYTRSHTKVIIVCKKHGEFLQRPCDHVNSKQGCPSCAHTVPLTLCDFQKRSDKKFDGKFKIISFTGIKHPSVIECNLHGEFTLPRAENHTLNAGGCPQCHLISRLDNLKPGRTSKAETEWLDGLNIPIRQHYITIGDKTIIADGFDPATNTVYEYYGSFWHGNPNVYPPNEMNSKLGVTHGHLYERTLERESLIKSEYHLVTKWSST